MKLRALCLVIAVGACAGDTALEPCDIRRSSCQLDVFMAVQDVRGSLWDPWLEPPPMRVISESQYRAEVIAAREQAPGQARVDLVTPALKLLHMIDPNEDPGAATDFMVASVAAYYDANTHDVTIVDRGATANFREGVQTLAHELVHAAQDRDVGFGRLYQRAGSTDNLNALAALLEGEATTYGLLVDAKQIDLAKGAINWRILADWASDVRTKIVDDLSPYRPANTELAYPLGGLYMSAAYIAGGPLELRRVYDDPPLSAARFLAGRAKPGDVAAPAWSCAPPEAPPGFSAMVADELGSMSVYAFATRFSLTEAQAWGHANMWKGDRFYIYADPNDSADIAVVWQLRFADALTAFNAQAALATAPWAASIQSVIEGDTLRVLATSNPLTMPYDAWTRCDAP